MSDGCTPLRLVLNRPEHAGEALVQDLRMPSGAGIDDLLLRLQKDSPEIHEEVRERILKSARKILAYGSEDGLMNSLQRGLSEGGTIILPGDDTLDTSFYPLGETETQH